MAMQLIPHSPQGFQCRAGGRRIRRDGHCKAVDHDVLSGHAVPICRLIDPAGDPHSALRVRGNSILVQDQRDQHAAILADQRKYGFYTLFFAIDGVDHGFSVIDPHAPLQRLYVCRIDLKGQGQHALQLLHHIGHHGRLVDLRQPHVHVENVRAAVFLPQTLPQDVFDIIVPECLLEFLLSGGIDPLTDDHRQRADLHTLRERTHNRPPLGDRLRKRQFLHPLRCQANMRRRRTAASTDHMDAHGGDLLHPIREFLRANVIDRSAPFCPWQARVRVHNNRYAAHFCEPLHNGNHLCRSQSAVDAKRIHAKALQKRHRRVHASACEEFPFLIEGDCDANRQVAVLLGRKNGRFGLIAVRHCLDQHKIRAGSASIAHNFPEQRYRPVKRQIAQRLQQLPGRSYIQCDIRVLAACPAPCLFGVFHRRRDDLLQVLREL